MSRTLTVANSVLTLAAPDLGIGPVQMQGFATDDAFDTPAVKPVEVLIGVDGRKSSGYVAYLVPFKFMLQADSPSVDIMDAIKQGMDAIQEDVELFGSLSAPSLGKLWTFNNGSLTSTKPTPQGKKLMQMLDFEITFRSIITALTAAP
jgi:hypothetical protein